MSRPRHSKKRYRGDTDTERSKDGKTAYNPKYVAIAFVSVLIAACVIVGISALDNDDDTIDMTRMSETAAAAMMDKIHSDPSSYIGKTIKLEGTYNSGGIDGWDPTGCCPVQWFFLEGYGGNNPENYEKIQVIGTYKYDSGQHILVVSSLTVL